MGSQVLTTSDRSRTYWTPLRERYFIDLMLDQVLKGNRTGHTFNKQAWTDMLTMFNAKFGSKYDKDVLKGRYKNMWEQYNDVKNLLGKTGFDWDETRQMVIASDHDWDEYVKEHPDLQSDKTKTIRRFNELCLIYGYTTADGRYSRSSHDVDLDDDVTAMKTGEGTSCQKINDHDRSRTNWTPEMDRFFVDLMLDQVHKGNKIEQTFNKKAWGEMILSFNDKFEAQYSKNVLRSRYKILRKHYTDMKVLLGQSGFDLNESRQMVLADDCVWDAYIKAHPDARSSRCISVPDYNDLYLIYGNETADGRKARTAHKRASNLGGGIGAGNESQTHTSCDRSRTYWTPPMDRYFIDLMLDQVYKGNKIDNTFIGQAWTDMTKLFNARFLSRHDKDVLKNRYKSLRKQYTDIKILLDQNGFTWDESRQMVTADDNVWDAYIKAHPDARSYRIRIVPNYSDLCMICGSATPNGRYHRLDRNANYDKEVLPNNTGGMGDQDGTISTSTGTYWTPRMDHYFIDLLLEHVREGNMINHTFTKEEWVDMITLFNAEFGCQYGEDVLLTRYNYLWLQYNDIRILLGNIGFSWDESQQMIIADDDVWATYIKENPHMQYYQNKTCPYYTALCGIFGNGIVGEISNSKNYTDLDYYASRSTIGGLDCQTSTTYDGSTRTHWTPSMDCYFIDLMVEQVQKENKIDNAFNKQAWTEMITLFNTQFDSQHEKDVLKNRYKNLRRQFNDIKNLLSQSGFVWDETRQMVTADDDSWDSYLKEHPDARSYINKTILRYDSLCVIFGDIPANGTEHRCHENADPKVDDEIIASEKTDRENSDAPTSAERSRTYWTPPMDRYYIDLMLDQVREGNKVDHTFNKQAWAQMITCFNEKFESQYDKDVLKSRYKNLRKQFNYTKFLLNQEGFDWDENRQMVVADDDVWDSYIKKHPDAQSFRTKILANYKDLSVIYENGYVDQRESHSAHLVDIDSDEVPAVRNYGLSGGPQSSSTSLSQRAIVNGVKESTPHLGNQQHKRTLVTPIICQQSRKLQRRDDNNIKDQNHASSLSIENMMNSLQALPDMDEDLLLDACDLLEDERKAKTFLTLDVKLRKKWLLRKLRP